MTQNLSQATKRIALLSVVIPLLGFWLYGLTDLDEGFYGAVVTDMLRRGDWVTPTLNGVPWFEKPILSYWVAAPLLALWHSEFMARLPSALAMLATSLAVYRQTRRWLGDDAALLSSVVFATSLVAVYIGRAMMTDGVFVLCLSSGLFLLFDSFVSKESSRLWTALLIGLAVLAKGPVSLLLLGAIAITSFVFMKSDRPRFKRHWLTGALIVLAVATTWYLPCYLQNGELFVQKFLVEQNVGRFLGKDVAHAVDAWSIPVYYPLVLALSFAWWLAPAFRAKWVSRRATDETEAGRFRKFLWVWATVVLVFFSLSGSKLPHYILPAVVPFAILLADAVIHRHPCGHTTRFWIGTGAVWACLASVTANIVTALDHQSRFADVQSLAKAANAIDAPLYAGFERKKVDYSVKLSLNDTSHPSIGFYYERQYRSTFTSEDVTAQTDGFALLTRDEDYSSAIATLRKEGRTINATFSGRYVLYTVSPGQD